MAAARSVVLLGKGDLAIRVGTWFHEHGEYSVDWVVPVVPEPTWTGSLSAWALERSIPLVETGDYGDLLADATRRWGLGFSVFYDRILPADFIARCDRILNLHPSPLPRYRGLRPINWALKNGEPEHGVTIHEIAAGIDDGPIVSQLTYSIYPEVDEVRDVYERSLAYAWTLFEQTLPILDRIQARPQDEHRATRYTASDLALLGDRRSFTRAESGTAPPGPVTAPPGP
jgi:methionyl-tRNA formyltransferase